MEKTKVFFDIEKETEWLNQMSKQGYRLTDRKHFTYYFAECSKESYIYQVERRTFDKKEEYEDYRDFIAGMNIRIAANQWGWIYYEKENDGKEFQICTDISSKITYYKNLITTWMMIAVCCLCLVIRNLNPPVILKESYLIGAHGPYFMNVSLPLVINAIIVVYLTMIIIKYLRKIIHLRKEQEIYE